jgi:hypothetical protein
MTTVKECRDHANECERLALEATDHRVKQSYFEIAQTWRNLADKLDRRDMRRLGDPLQNSK